MQSSPSTSSASNAQSPTSAKSPDYVYFERTTAGFSDDAVPKAKAAQLKLEHFYKVAVDAAIERNTRCVAPRSTRAMPEADTSLQTCRARAQARGRPHDD